MYKTVDKKKELTSDPIMHCAVVDKDVAKFS